MTLHFPARRCKCNAAFSIQDKTVVITEAELNRSSAPLVYAAIGYEKERVFYPIRTVTKAKLPLKLPLPQGNERPVVQLVNTYGDQVFFTID